MLKLKELRKSKRLTQQDIADFLKIERNSYTRYENESRFPTLSALIKLADFYGVSIDYILGRSDSPAIVIDTKTNPSPDDQERAASMASSVLAGLPVNTKMPEDIEELSELIRQIVDLELDKRSLPNDDQS